MKTNLWSQINDFLFFWKGNGGQIYDFGWGGEGGRGRGGEKYRNLFMRPNLWYQINKFIYEIYFSGVYKHKNS